LTQRDTRGVRMRKNIVS